MGKADRLPAMARGRSVLSDSSNPDPRLVNDGQATVELVEDAAVHNPARGCLQDRPPLVSQSKNNNAGVGPGRVRPDIREVQIECDE